MAKHASAPHTLYRYIAVRNRTYNTNLKSDVVPTGDLENPEYLLEWLKPRGNASL